VQNLDELSSLIKNQQKSSSIQRLKIVKKVSVNSAAPGEQDRHKHGVDALTSNSVERTSAGGNSSLSLN